MDLKRVFCRCVTKVSQRGRHQSGMVRLINYMMFIKCVFEYELLFQEIFRCWRFVDDFYMYSSLSHFLLLCYDRSRYDKLRDCLTFTTVNPMLNKIFFQPM